MIQLRTPLIVMTLATCGVFGPTEEAQFGVAAEPVKEQLDVIYGRKSDLALTLDVFTPPVQNGAAIIHLANGGWHKAHGEVQNFAAHLDRGYTVFRVLLSSEPKFTVLEQMPDVARAVRFVRAHAADFHIDPNRLGIEGASSGGHMSLLHAMGGDDGNSQAADPVERVSSRVQAAAVFFPLTDLLNYGQTGAEQGGDLGPLKHHRASFDFTRYDPALRAFVKVTDPAERRELLRQASPITYVTAQSPPTLLVHGDRDEVVPLQQSEVLAKKLRDCGVKVELIVHPGGGHSWPNFWSEDGGKLVDWFDACLRAIELPKQHGQAR